MRMQMLNIVKAIARRILPAPIKHWIKYLMQRPSFVLEINPEQICRVYTTRHHLYDNFPNRVLLTDQCRPRVSQPVSLIATVKNEGDSIIQWLKSIQRQTRIPDEIIIVDGGSSDDTVQKIQEFENEHRLGIRLLLAPGANIASGRNIAIRHAKHEIIAITDAGCELDPNWLTFITMPFDLHPETEIVAGFYEAIVKTSFERTVASFLVPKVHGVNPLTFSPSSRSLALRKTFWEKIGGYPEYLTRAGEDTLMNVLAKRAAREWAFVPDAIVYWRPPNSLKRLFKTLYSWGRGDGEAQLYTPTYIKLIIIYVAIILLLLLTIPAILLLWPLGLFTTFCSLTIWLSLLKHYGVWESVHKGLPNRLRAIVILSTIHLAQMLGYYRGWRNRPQVFRRKLANVNKNFLVLAGIPIYDTGGGQRSTQLTLELLRRGFKVTYVHRFPSYETKPVRLCYFNPLLDVMRFEKFNLRKYIREHRFVLNKTFVLVEFPLREYLKIAQIMRRYGALIIYDCMDDWNSSLGGDWYSQLVENELITSSDLLIATSLNLKRNLEQRAPGKFVLYLPNAVNTQLFDVDRKYERPADLPLKHPIIGYIGSMYGDWFREDLVIKVAQAYPEASIVLIGDHRQRFANRPKNLYTLGLKAHQQIPAYLAYFDVCIIPFKSSLKLVQATNPLKVYEYLAMGKPVVTTLMRELEGLPYVYISRNDEEFIANIALALQTRAIDKAMIKSFSEQNSWKARVDTLLLTITNMLKEAS